jgi:hypothetical protein
MVRLGEVGREQPDTPEVDLPCRQHLQDDREPPSGASDLDAVVGLALDKPRASRQEAKSEL